MSADLAVQKAIRDRLVAAPAVTALVPAGHILDRNERPECDPLVSIGESQAVEYGDIARRGETVFATLHVWKKEEGLKGAKAIAGAIRAAIHSARLSVTGYHCGNSRVTSTRFLRDPDGETAHGIVTVEALVVETP